jgi:NAD+ diphosphatase
MDLYSSVSEGNESSFDCKPLREFGDLLEASHDAGILATANGLVEFHKSHGYCSRCGGRTQATKAGASRTCTKEGCRKSVYPRIDSATIMLVTSPCENYALLGRKRSWPLGRYSTLAGFCEVGETLEECCQRETYEESGVVIDPKSIRFAASQPWPFPRSLMVGFRAKAMAMPSLAAAALPKIVVDTNEMEDVRWVAKDFVKESLKLNGSTALTFQPNEEESNFHVPGKASLARFLITEWVYEKGNHN